MMSARDADILTRSVIDALNDFVVPEPPDADKLSPEIVYAWKQGANYGLTAALGVVADKMPHTCKPDTHGHAIIEDRETGICDICGRTLL